MSVRTSVAILLMLSALCTACAEKHGTTDLPGLASPIDGRPAGPSSTLTSTTSTPMSTTATPSNNSTVATAPGPAPNTTGDSANPPPSPTPAPVHRTGTATLTDKQGIDLDSGNITNDETAPGVDISPYSKASHLGAMASSVSYAILPAGTPTDHDHCTTATNWTRYYADMYQLTAGRGICVNTDESRLSAMVIDTPATESSGTFGFHFITWK